MLLFRKKWSALTLKPQSNLQRKQLVQKKDSSQKESSLTALNADKAAGDFPAGGKGWKLVPLYKKFMKNQSFLDEPVS